MNIAKNLQGRLYKVWSILLPNCFPFGVLNFSFGHISHYTPTSCCYATRISEIALTIYCLAVALIQVMFLNFYPDMRFVE